MPSFGPVLPPPPTSSLFSLLSLSLLSLSLRARARALSLTHIHIQTYTQVSSRARSLCFCLSHSLTSLSLSLSLSLFLSLSYRVLSASSAVDGDIARAALQHYHSALPRTLWWGQVLFSPLSALCSLVCLYSASVYIHFLSVSFSLSLSLCLSVSFIENTREYFVRPSFILAHTLYYILDY